MHIKHKRAIAAVSVLALVLIIMALGLSYSSINSISCAHLCAYRTTYSNGRLSIWLAWANQPLRNATVEIYRDKLYVANAVTSADGAISLYAAQGFGGSSITMYYHNYFVSDYVYGYPYIQSLIYIVIGAFAYIVAKKASDHSLSNKKVSIGINDNPASSALGCRAGLDNGHLQRSIAIAATDRPDAIRYCGIVADLQAVCKKAALQAGIGMNHAAALSDEVDAAIHFSKAELGMSVINGTIYGDASASIDACAKHLYEKALYSGTCIVPRAATSRSIIKANLAGICDGSNVGALASTLMRSGKHVKPVAVQTADKARMLNRACAPRKKESAFMFMYLSNAISVIYV